MNTPTKAAAWCVLLILNAQIFFFEAGEKLIAAPGSIKLQDRFTSALIPETLSPTNSIYVRSQKLASNDGAANDEFGTSVAISGNYAVVGAPYHDVGSNSDQGAAYVYVRDGETWAFQQKLTSTGGSTNDHFGVSVDIDGSNIVVGADNVDVVVSGTSLADRGAAYVFSRSGTTWSLVTALTNNTIDTTPENHSEHFGHSVAIEASTIAVGAPDDDTDGSTTSRRSGSISIYAYVSSTWTVALKSAPPVTGIGTPKFGQSVAISGNNIIAGGPQCIPSALPSPTPSQPFTCTMATQGVAAIYTGGGLSWSFATYMTNGVSSLSSFGASVAIDGTTAVIGAPGPSVEKAYVSQYSGSSWSSPAQLSGGTNYHSFGKGVAIDGDMLVVTNQAPNTIRGRAYVFRFIDSVWTFKTEIFQKDVASGTPDGLGDPVGIDGNRIIIGAYKETVGANAGQGTAPIFNNVAPRPFDFDGDTTSDVSVFRPSSADWYYTNPGASGYTQVHFGASGDELAPGDFDGDGKSDLAVFRSGTWYILNSSNSQTTTTSWGSSGDLPMPNDFDNDGKADVAVFRPSNSTWYWLPSSNPQYTSHQFGQSGDIPLMADFDGDSKGELALFRPGTTNSSFTSYNLATSQTVSQTFGSPGDIPTVGDFDGDSKTDIAVFRPSNSTWYRVNSSSAQTVIVGFGASGDIPTVGDFDGDGEADLAVFRPSTQVWYIANSGYSDVLSVGAQFTIMAFGAANDIPVPATY